MALQLASRLSLIAFATSLIRGLLVGSDFRATLQAGLFAAAAFYGLGLLLGELARRLVEEHVVAQLAHLDTEKTKAHRKQQSMSA